MDVEQGRSHGEEGSHPAAAREVDAQPARSERSTGSSAPGDLVGHPSFKVTTAAYRHPSPFASVQARHTVILPARRMTKRPAGTEASGKRQGRRGIKVLCVEHTGLAKGFRVEVTTAESSCPPVLPPVFLLSAAACCSPPAPLAVRCFSRATARWGCGTLCCWGGCGDWPRVRCSTKHQRETSAVVIPGAWRRSQPEAP